MIGKDVAYTVGSVDDFGCHICLTTDAEDLVVAPAQPLRQFVLAERTLFNIDAIALSRQQRDARFVDLLSPKWMDDK
jgi:hypothetical protein